jgi:hypothetical protein
MLTVVRNLTMKNSTVTSICFCFFGVYLGMVMIVNRLMKTLKRDYVQEIPE